MQCILQHSNATLPNVHNVNNVPNVQSFLVSPISIRAIANVWDPPLIQASLKGKYRSGHAISDVSAIPSENIQTEDIQIRLVISQYFFLHFANCFMYVAFSFKLTNCQDFT